MSVRVTVAPSVLTWALDVTGADQEKLRGRFKKKVKIPDVCDAFDVEWMDPFSMYRALGMRLGGGPK